MRLCASCVCHTDLGLQALWPFVRLCVGNFKSMDNARPVHATKGEGCQTSTSKKSRRLLTIIATPIICMIRTMHAYRRDCIGLMRMAHVRIHTLELEFSSLLGMLIFKSPIYGLRFQGSSSAWAWSQLSLVVAGGEVLRLVFQAVSWPWQKIGAVKTLGSLEVGFQWTIVVCASVTECIPIRPQLRIKSPRGPSHQARKLVLHVARLNKSDPPKHSPKSSWQFDHHGCPLSPLPGFPTQHKFFK